MGRDPGASPGAANTDAWRSLRCFVFWVTRGSGDKSTTQRLERGLERHKVFVRGYLFISGDRMQILIVPVTFGPWSAMCSVCPRVVRIILVSVLGSVMSVMSPHTRHTFKQT